MPIIQQRMDFEVPTPRDIMQPFEKSALGLHIPFTWSTAERKKANRSTFVKYTHFWKAVTPDLIYVYI